MTQPTTRRLKTVPDRPAAFARDVYQKLRRVFPDYAHPRSPRRFTQPQLFACILLALKLGLSHRQMERWLLSSEATCRALDLTRIPDYSTLSRAFLRMADPALLVRIEAVIAGAPDAPAPGDTRD